MPSVTATRKSGIMPSMYRAAPSSP
jgi:hypothetical protein